MGIPAISTPVLQFFRLLVSRYFRRQFHGVRTSGANHFVCASGPLIVYANHSSWWDPMVAILLASKLMPGRKHYAPMDAEALERYGILKRLGIFPVEMKSARGAVQFLRTGQAVLADGGVLWVTPQGRFLDARQRPLEFRPGLAALAVRAAKETGSCSLLPMAIEYVFWDERLPECLLRFGEPIRVDVGEATGKLEARLRDALTRQMDALRAIAVQRDARLFTTLAEGTSGAGGFYALGKRIVAFVLRRPYRPEHTRMDPNVPASVIAALKTGAEKG